MSCLIKVAQSCREVNKRLLKAGRREPNGLCLLTGQEIRGYPEGVVNLQLDCVCIGDGVNAAMCWCGFTATHTAEVFTELEMGWDIKLHQSRTEENMKNYVFFTLLLLLMEMSASSSSVI